jgi:choline dehydrogenase-like flavoprotein
VPRPDLLVVGSGASAVHFALTALRRGHAVTIVDVGYPRGPVVAPAATFDQLKDDLDDPVEYFLGATVDKVVFPSLVAKHYGFPPSKDYVFEHPAPFAVRTTGFEPTISFARGGLAEAWTGGCYELADFDLAGWPIGLADLQPFYGEVARRIGVAGADDDLARFAPFTAPYMEPLALDAHSARLLDAYARKRGHLNERLGFYLGRSRVATLTRDHGDRRGCSGLGRCLWGCPRESLYAPSYSLRECAAFPGFRYVPGHYVRHFVYDARGRVSQVVASDLATGRESTFPADVVVLAAGTLGTSRLYLESVRRAEGRAPALPGLMDNTHVVIPFVNLAHLGQPVQTASYQFHHLALGIAGPGGTQAGHGQITSLRAASVHPIIQGLPLGFRAGVRVLRRIRSALGVANVWGPGTRREDHRVTLREDAGRPLVVECAPDDEALAHITRLAGTVRAALGELGCVAPGGMSRILPLGSSVHYAGTLPMTVEDQPHTCTPDGRVRGFTNLIVADGASFPSLPAKNLTFTLMANACRLAGQLA